MVGSRESAAAARWEAGGSVDGHRLLARLGSGGSGEVWRARDPDGRGEVALKRLVARAAVSPGAVERLRREAERAGRLNSPHVVPVYGTGETADGTGYVVMRLVPDGDLAAVLCRHPSGVAPAYAARVISQLAHALDTAHGQGIVHRDVTPANVLVERTADGDVVQLGDFGLAVDAGASGTGAGTGAYRAPETSGGGRVTGAVDVYALGCLLVELLTGRPPFPGPDGAGFRYQHEHAPPCLPGAVHPWLAPFDPVVARALAKHPGHRFPTAGELAGAVALAAAAVPGGGRWAPPPESRAPRPVPPGSEPRRRWTPGARIAVAAATVVVLVVGWAGYAVTVRPAPPWRFANCVDGLGVTATAVDNADGPSYRIGLEPAIIQATFFDSAPVARERLGLLRRFPGMPGYEQGSEVVADRVLVTWQWGAHPSTVLAVQECV